MFALASRTGPQTRAAPRALDHFNMETAHRSRKTDGRRPLQQSLISRNRKTLHAISQRRPRSCAVCSQIVHAFKAEFEELRVYLGTVPELLSSPCITHRALLLYHLDYMQRHFSGRNRYPPEHFDLVYLIKRKGNLVMLSHTSLPRPCGPSLALVKTRQSPVLTSAARFLIPSG